MTNLLVLEASSDLCLVALQAASGQYNRAIQGARAHSEHLLDFVDAVLADADMPLDELDAIAFSAGPGSFTGIRLAASIAKGLAFASQKPVILLSSLQILAESYFEGNTDVEEVVVINDARMGDVYQGHYQRDQVGAIAVSPDVMIKVADLVVPPLKIIGDAQHLLPALADASPLSPTAESLLRLAERAYQDKRFTTALDAVPVYLRDKTSWKTVDQQMTQRG